MGSTSRKSSEGERKIQNSFLGTVERVAAKNKNRSTQCSNLKLSFSKPHLFASFDFDSAFHSIWHLVALVEEAAISGQIYGRLREIQIQITISNSSFA